MSERKVKEKRDEQKSVGSCVPDSYANSAKWSGEKEQLLNTHRGWFVAYQDGERVALEPSLDRLVAAMDEKLGSPRKPCEFHEIIEQPLVERGPSPRYSLVHSKK